MNSAIAVIGMSGRFPGANDLDEYWDNIVSGRLSLMALSEEDVRLAGVSRELREDVNYVRVAAVLDDVESFAAPFFDYSPREASVMDPQHRIFLECAWEVMENAGYGDNSQPRSVGVFAGAGGILSSYIYSRLSPKPQLVGATGSIEHLGNDKDFLSTRVSYKLNLTGPSVTVQTACSSSLVAVHMACQSLLCGECEMAMAGGVTVRFPQRAGYVYQSGGILSQDGRCLPFDYRATGTVFGSGAGLVLLKLADRALQDGDHIDAVIRGTAINNDGSGKISFGAASADGQERAIRRASSTAGIRPDSLCYVEAHGTATVLGDPVEIQALTNAFRWEETGNANQYCAIGSVKANVGHLEAAAGVAGLIKTVLVLKNRVIPPSVYFEKSNPKIRFSSTPFFVPKEAMPWTGSVRRAAVNSLGIGGTNAFAILEEAPLCPQPPANRNPLHESGHCGS
jgi:acyl transferase domain-containing protein